jgi:peptidyl-dipeptidase Dcp
MTAHKPLKMKTVTYTVAVLVLIICSTLFVLKMTQRKNPFYEKYAAPFEVPPFDKIQNADYLPAIKEGIKQQQAEIQKITSNTATPTFTNTIEALEFSGDLLKRTRTVLDNIISANTTPELLAIQKEASPLLSKQADDISLNADLFKKVKAVWETKEQFKLNTEQAKLLENYYIAFRRGGANLTADKQARLREVNQKINMLQIQFGENVLEENKDFKMILDKKEDLVGLPQSVIDAAASNAKSKGLENKWLFTLSKTSMIPFITSSERRDLREKIYKGYLNKGNNGNKFDNNKIVAEIVTLRLDKANLLGFKTFADYALERTMAEKPENVYKLLQQLWVPSLAVSKKEAAELQAMINKEGKGFKLESWDWWFYSEKVRAAKYDFNEEALRPYFKLENVREGIFYAANKLYGLKFNKRDDLPKYHPSVDAFEVTEADGKHIGILYLDYYARPEKRSGAWMTNYRDQSVKDGVFTSPVVTVVLNSPPPTSTQPSLLNFDETQTFFHEFGHALHGLLTKCTYPSISGTAVYRDFVELPSQIMENWASEPELLKIYARHYKTNEVIPQILLDKMKASAKFNQGFSQVEILAAATLDMDYHTVADLTPINTQAFEKQSLNRMKLIPEIAPRYRSTYFSHIFEGEYSAGYYSYSWAAVLDADAFSYFKKNGIFDAKTAQAFRTNILERGGTENPMVLYKRFTGGNEPTIQPLLERLGLK